MTAFLLDEDVPPEAAEIGRGLGLDVLSVSEVGRLGGSDERQLETAAADGRIFVTYNRNDFILLTRRFFELRAPHAGVLIVPSSIPRRLPARLAHALRRWEDMTGEPRSPRPAPYLCVFLEP